MTDDDTRRLHVATFLAQALDLEDDPAVLAAEFQALKRDPNAGIWTVELDSSVGPAAFLVYHYLLDVAADGRTGQDLFDADLATLERAGELDSPGPRVLAHAQAGDEAFILATTPATFSALTGEATSDTQSTTDSPPPSLADVDQTRRNAASELFTLLQRADREARSWLESIGMGGTADPAGATLDGAIDLNEEETALALFLLDNHSIQHLLRSLNLLIETAQHRAIDAIRREPEDI